MGKNKIIEIVKQYYVADSEKNFERIADFFEFNIIDYYSKSNVTRAELIQILSDYWNKSDLIQSKSTIDFDSWKIEEKEDGTYKVSFKNNYEVLRSDKSKPNHFLTNTQITFNKNLKIISVNGNVISKWIGESTLSQVSNDQSQNITSSDSKFVIAQKIANQTFTNVVANGMVTKISFTPLEGNPHTGAMILSQLGCNYGYVYRLEGNQINIDFTKSDCGNSSPDNVLYFNSVSDDLYMYIEGVKFVFTKQ